MFCPECGSLLVPKERCLVCRSEDCHYQRDLEDDTENCPLCGSPLVEKKDRAVCSDDDCDFSKDKEKPDSMSKKITEEMQESEIKVLEDQLDTLPKTRQECPKCHHKEAYWFLRQTRAADEATTRFYVCVKCNHRWREY